MKNNRQRRAAKKWQPLFTILRWLPFLAVLTAFTLLAETREWRRLFIRVYGDGAWDNLHWYASASLFFLAYLAQPRRRPAFIRLLVAGALTITIGLTREVLQKVALAAQGSRHDMRSNAGGTAVGATLSLIWESWRTRRRK